MGFAVWQYAALGAFAVASVFAFGAFVYLRTQEEGDDAVDWSNYQIKDGELPPEPIFNSRDNEDCITVVEGYYESSVNSFEYTQRDNAKLEQSYNNILDRQRRYGVNLVNNSEFRDWVLSDWELSWMAQDDP